MGEGNKKQANMKVREHIMKKFLSCILILATILALAQPAFAAQLPGNDPQYANAQRVYVNMYINRSGKSTISLCVRGKAGLKNTGVSVHVEKKTGSTWVPIERWTSSVNRGNLAKTKSVQLTGTGEYRVVANFVLIASTTEYVSDVDYATY